MNSREVQASGTSSIARLLTTIRTRLLDPPVLVIIAVVFLISAVGQAMVQAYVGADSAVVTTVLSVLGSLSLALAIIIAARRTTEPVAVSRRSRQRPSRLVRLCSHFSPDQHVVLAPHGGGEGPLTRFRWSADSGRP